MDTIGEVKKLLDNEAVTKYAIAKEIGVSDSTLMRILNGQTKSPKKDTLFLLAQYLHAEHGILPSDFAEEIGMGEEVHGEGAGAKKNYRKPIEPKPITNLSTNMNLEHYQELVRLLKKENEELREKLDVCMSESQRFKKST